MKRLFIELYLDEDVDVLIAGMIRARGFEVLTTLEAGRLGSTDAEQLEYAASAQKAIVTHNRVDFEALAQTYYRAERTHSGIIVAVRRPPREVARRLLVILDQMTADEMDNNLLYI